MEYIVIGLLAVIAGVECYRFFLAVRPSTRARHFKNRLENTRNNIWDLQFKVFKTREIREEIRQEYDMMKSRIENFDNQIKNWPADKPVEERKKIEDDKIRAERDAERFLKQMAALDVEVEGSKPTVEMPDGHTGITQQIDSLRELEQMLKDYIKN